MPGETADYAGMNLPQYLQGTGLHVCGIHDKGRVGSGKDVFHFNYDDLQ